MMIGTLIALAAGAVFRPPAIPLITADPFMQTFVMGDTSVSDTVRHWDGVAKETIGLIRVDNATYSFLGYQNVLPSLVQRSVVVHPTRTVFELSLPGVLSLTLEFLQSAFTDDVHRLSRPVYYVTFRVVVEDGKQHAVELYFDATAQHVVNDCSLEAVKWSSWSREARRGAAP